jgi:predicted nucleic acid-binding protein
MRVMVDTNIIISAMVFKSSKMCDVLRKVKDGHELCIAAYSIKETEHILNEKFKNIEANIEKFFASSFGIINLQALESLTFKCRNY